MEPKFTIHEMPHFSKWVRKNRLQSAVEALKEELSENPDVGDVIPGGGGLRKVRMAGLGRGKSGGFRVVYVLFLDRTAALLLAGYSKSAQDDLSADEVKELVSLQAGVVTELMAQAKRTTSQPEENS